MNYIQFRESLKKFSLFSIADIKKMESQFYKARLCEWQKKGYIQKIIKGYYIFSDTELNERYLFEIANHIYAPSYISLEMALSYYGLIPESVYSFTSISTRKTSSFTTPIGNFSYRSLRPHLFFGYELKESTSKKYFKIASPEKALLDYFYLHPHIKDGAGYESLRINKEIFFKYISQKKMNLYLKKFNQKTLRKRIHAFWEFMKHA